MLGHEIEHIDHYHCAERVQVEDAIRHTALGAVVAPPVAVLMAGYSKDQEFQADREGVKLAAAVSYSPQGAIRVFEAFERLFPAAQTPRRSPPEGLSDAALKTLEGYFQSHPPSAERIDQIRKMIASGQLPNWTRTTPLPVEFYFLTERSFRALGRAELPMRGGLSNKDRKTWQAERDEYYRQAGTLAAQSLALRSDQPRALSILAVASYGLGDFAAGAATYHKLLPDYPAFADSIRQHLEALARQALAVENYAKAASLASHALDLQPDQDSLLKTLAEAQFGLKDFTGASETCRKLKALYPSAADAVRSAADTLADAALARHEYRDAASLAAQSLELKPGQLRMLRILAQAEFAQANFAPAAVAYRKVLDQQIWDLDWVRGYADALSVSAGPRPFADWLDQIHLTDVTLLTQAHIELAGLRLKEGDESEAASILASTRGASNLFAPGLLGRLGWWYYRAAKYQMSQTVLRQALALRPGDFYTQAALGWSELHEGRFESAIRLFTAASGEAGWNSPLMGRAIACWQTSQAADALKDFEAVIAAAPYWRNPRWVTALFPENVVQAVAAMDAAWQERQTGK